MNSVVSCRIHHKPILSIDEPCKTDDIIIGALPSKQLGRYSLSLFHTG